MRLKAVAMSVVAGMFLVSSVYADQGVGEGGGSEQGVDQQQSDAIQGGGQPGAIEGGDPQGSDLGGIGQQGGMQDQASVRQVQEKLSQQGYDVGPIDGIFGPRTEQAVRKFQEDKGVQPTGQIDQQTMAALGIEGEGGAQPGDMGAGQPDAGTEGSDLGSGGQPDAGIQPPDAGAEGAEQQGSDAGALQE